MFQPRYGLATRCDTGVETDFLGEDFCQDFRFKASFSLAVSDGSQDSIKDFVAALPCLQQVLKLLIAVIRSKQLQMNARSPNTAESSCFGFSDLRLQAKLTGAFLAGH